MQKLIEIESSISNLYNKDYAELREWFWKQENERWDTQLQMDIKDGKLEDLTSKAVEDFTKGNFRKL